MRNAVLVLTAAACGGVAVAAETPARAPALQSAADAKPALDELDAISASDWLLQRSGALLDRVIAASSKAALDAAAESDPRAQALVGTGYMVGIDGYAQSNDDAVKFYRLAASSNPIAQNNLGSLLSGGQANGGVPAPEEAAKFYRLAAEQGHPVAQGNLAIIYRDGTGVPQDDAQAAHWFSLAAAQGNAQSQYELGRLYFLGRGVAQDFDEADRLYQAAADQGHADGLFAVAEQADLDNLFAKLAASDAAAQPYMDSWEDDWVEPTAEEIAAADKADREHDELEKFDPTPLYHKALEAYERDAATGNSYAMGRVGDMYYKHQGTPADNAKAFAWFSRAAEAGNAYGEARVAQMLELGEGVEKDEAEAVRRYRLLADRGDVNGETNLARMYELGHGGLDVDATEAIRLYRLAAQQGDESAQKRLQQLGVPVTPPESEAEPGFGDELGPGGFIVPPPDK